MKWNNSDNLSKAYGYTYDNTKQLSAANFMQKSGSSWSVSDKYAEKGIPYDLNGNIKTLLRNNSSGNPLHTISYNYNVAGNGDAISNVNINGTTTGDYVYDEAGNLTFDGQRGINIEYNVLNLPEKIFARTEEISYIYTSSGEKLVMRFGSSLTYYRGPFIYNGDILDHIVHPEGVIRRSTGDYIYYYAKTDHTGSVRTLCHAVGDTMVADQTTEYYPHGLSYQNENLNLNRYLYSGKELQDQTINGKLLGLYDFGSRNYDPILGRWFNVDPALQMTNPYGYCANNPIIYNDPHGEFFIIDDFVVGFFKGLFKGKNAWKSGIEHAHNSVKIWGGLFQGSFGQILSRFTWEGTQTGFAFLYAGGMNFVDDIRGVDYYRGATVVKGRGTSGMAMTLGSYIFGGSGIEGDPTNSTFQHEYGHYLQSQKSGPLYLERYGMPSLFSSGTHKNHPVEQDANVRAIEYFGKGGIETNCDFKINPILGYNGNENYNSQTNRNYFG